jgi:hypothetical protein
MRRVPVARAAAAARSSSAIAPRPGAPAATIAPLLAVVAKTARALATAARPIAIAPTDRNRAEARSRGREDRSTDRNRTEARSRGREDRSTDRSEARNRGTFDRSEARDRGTLERNRHSGGAYRDSSRGRSDHRSYGNRQHYFHHGRISRMHRYGGGYRVWIIGAPYPFFVPDAYYHRNRFRVGLTIRLGGYYNPLGYYDYYDGYGSYDRRPHSSATLRGVVESVDDRRGTFVIRNEATGSFVTIGARDRRRDVRPGDYVEVYGGWNRSGLFDAYDVDLLDDRDDRRYDDRY